MLLAVKMCCSLLYCSVMFAMLATLMLYFGEY